LRIAQQRPRDAEPLLHPQRIARDLVAGASAQVNQLQDLVDPAGRCHCATGGKGGQVLAA
jgi:hypothetical protein